MGKANSDREQRGRWEPKSGRGRWQWGGEEMAEQQAGLETPDSRVSHCPSLPCLLLNLRQQGTGGGHTDLILDSSKYGQLQE